MLSGDFASEDEAFLSKSQKIVTTLSVYVCSNDRRSASTAGETAIYARYINIADKCSGKHELLGLA